MAKPTGIRVRHSRSCPAAKEKTASCRCSPSYEAWTFDRRTGSKIRRSFRNLSEAKTWRADATVGLRKGTFRAPTSTTLQQAWDAWLAGARDGAIRTRSGDSYKPSAIRSYEASMRLRILGDYGAVKLSEIRRVDLQDLADRWLADGLDPSTIRNSLMPLRAVFRRAVSRGELAVNPTSGLELPAVRGKRDRIASPAEATKLLATLPESERALWATALYAGLRRGELMALRWDDIDLAAGVIRVERAWDAREGVIEPKSHAGKRTVPIPRVLREYLAAAKLRSEWSEGFAFGRSATRPFDPVAVGVRAGAAWKKLAPLTMHQARHTFASLMIAAGVNAKALSTFMGHASITITLDRYGHLFPGSEDEAAALLDTYLDRVDVQQAREARSAPRGSPSSRSRLSGALGRVRP